jgi:hypothetical protein
MKSIYTIASFALLAAFTGCNGNDGPGSAASSSPASVRTDGTCTGTYVNDYNRINSEMKLYGKMIKWGSSDSQLRSQLHTVDDACNTFLNTHGAAVNCTALVNGAEQMVNGQDIVEPCRKAKELLLPSVDLNPNPSVNSDGTCTTNYVTDYNRVLDEQRALSRMITWNSSEFELRYQVLKLNSACDTFLNSHGSSVSCKARVDGLDRYIDSYKIADTCRKAKEIH